MGYFGYEAWVQQAITERHHVLLFLEARVSGGTAVALRLRQWTESAIKRTGKTERPDDQKENGMREDLSARTSIMMMGETRAWEGLEAMHATPHCENKETE